MLASMKENNWTIRRKQYNPSPHFQTMLEGLSVKEDLLEQSRNLALDDSRTWYCVDAVLENGETVRFAFSAARRP